MENNTGFDLDEVLDSYLTSEPYPRRVGVYWASELDFCIRKDYYQFFLSSEPDSHLRRVFGAGNVIHEMVADSLIKFSRSGEGVSAESEVPIRVVVPGDHIVVISGRIDDVVYTKDITYLIEVKSTTNVARQKRFFPKPSHRSQLNVYLSAYPGSEGIIYYVDRGTFESVQVPVKFDLDLFNATIDRAKRLDGYLRTNQLPPPEAMQDPQRGWECNFCPFREQCLSNTNFSLH